MKEFIEKLKSKLKEKLLEYINKANDEMIENGHTLDFENHLGHKKAYENVLYEIVNQLAEEYKGGWISCSERLPEVATCYLVTEEVTVNSKKQYVTDIRLFGTEDEWLCPSNRKIIAWQPLPQPYKENENGKI